MSAAVVLMPQVLPRVWATAAAILTERKGPHRLRLVQTEAVVVAQPSANRAEAGGYEFYRKYTEALLRRYMKMSMEAGRVPSLMGRELFRGNVTHYKVKNFEDVVMAELQVLKSQMEQIMGINQPGRLHHLEGRVRLNEQGVQRMKGFVGAFGIVTTVVHFALSYITGGAKHN